MANSPKMISVGLRLPQQTIDRLERVARTVAQQSGVPVPLRPSTLARELLLRALAEVEEHLGIDPETCKNTVGGKR